MPAQIQKQNRLVALLIILLGFIGGYMYYSSTEGGEFAPLEPESIKNAKTWGSLDAFRTIELKKSIIEDSRYEELKKYGEAPVDKGSPGKTSLFGR